MKEWNFKMNNSTLEISEKIKSKLDSGNRLVFNINQGKNDSFAFKMRKRILYPWYLFFLNSLVVNGNLTKGETENEANIEISFNQHFLWLLVIITDLIIGLAILTHVILNKNNNIYMYLIGAPILAIGFILWIVIQKKYERNVLEYKTLISEILVV